MENTIVSMPKRMTPAERRAVIAKYVRNKGVHPNNVTVHSNSSRNNASLHMDIRDPPPIESQHQVEAYNALENAMKK